LQALLNQPAESEAQGWPTFAGNPARQLPLPREVQDPERLIRTLRNGPLWKASLEQHARSDEPPVADKPVKALPLSTLARSLAFHPVIAGHHVLVADARSVTAYHLLTGAAQVWDLGRDGTVDGLDNLVTKLPAEPDLRYTLTVYQERVYVR